MGDVIWHAAWQIRDIYRAGDAEPGFLATLVTAIQQRFLRQDNIIDFGEFNTRLLVKRC